MSDIAIKVENLGKIYRIGEKQERYNTFRDTLNNIITAPFRRLQNIGKPAKPDELIWALKDVSFEVKHGEVVGIIGRNGAGKSTLLKILSQITEPTEGQATVYGRIGSLLEVGTGFHPELTGRENIFLNGAILGMSKAEINRKFDEIVDFAEIEKFIDTQVKHYSSGMYTRLAFAVAANLDPDILLVDEVLAVGDAEFQKKCLGKMSDVAKGGRTVLFVSHNMAAIQTLCRRVIWINNGSIVQDGQSTEVVSNYLKASSTATTERVWNDIATAPGNDQVRIRRACVRPENGSASDQITIRTPFVMEFEYWNLKPNAYLNLSVHLYNEQGIVVFATGPVREPVWHGHPFPVGLFRSMFHVPGDLLNDRIHRVGLLVVRDQENGIYFYDDILVFDVHDVAEKGKAWYGKWPGAVRPNLEWSTELVEADKPSVLPVRRS
jgi:lipopolysaccharide transport system ATP-binding protein